MADTAPSRHRGGPPHPLDEGLFARRGSRRSRQSLERSDLALGGTRHCARICASAMASRPSQLRCLFRIGVSRTLRWNRTIRSSSDCSVSAARQAIPVVPSSRAANPFEVPRTGDYPQPRLEITEAGVMFNATAERPGYKPFPAPAANSSQPYVSPDGQRLRQCQCLFGSMSRPVAALLGGAACQRRRRRRQKIPLNSYSK